MQIYRKKLRKTINYMTNYMVITCKQKNGNLLVLKTYNYHELSINICSLVLWSKKNMFFCYYV